MWVCNLWVLGEAMGVGGVERVCAETEELRRDFG